MARFTLVLLTAALLTACSWVNVTPAGQKVRVLAEADVAKCERVGQTAVSVLAKVAGLNRYPEQVQEELNTLARNSAADLHGDTVAPISPVVEGKQTFGVYRCMQ